MYHFSVSLPPPLLSSFFFPKNKCCGERFSRVTFLCAFFAAYGQTCLPAVHLLLIPRMTFLPPFFSTAYERLLLCFMVKPFLMSSQDESLCPIRPTKFFSFFAGEGGCLCPLRVSFAVPPWFFPPSVVSRASLPPPIPARPPRNFPPSRLAICASEFNLFLQVRLLQPPLRIFDPMGYKTLESSRRPPSPFPGFSDRGRKNYFCLGRRRSVI